MINDSMKSNKIYIKNRNDTTKNIKFKFYQIFLKTQLKIIFEID